MMPSVVAMSAALALWPDGNEPKSGVTRMSVGSRPADDVLDDDHDGDARHRGAHVVQGSPWSPPEQQAPDDHQRDDDERADAAADPVEDQRRDGPDRSARLDELAHPLDLEAERLVGFPIDDDRGQQHDEKECATRPTTTHHRRAIRTGAGASPSSISPNL